MAPRKPSKPVADADVERLNKRRPPSDQLVRKCDARVRVRDTWDGKSRCPRGAGWGTTHKGWGRCKNHGGSTVNGMKHAAMLAAQHEVEIQRNAMRFYGVKVHVNPAEALIEELHRTTAIVRWLEDMMAGWAEDAARREELTASDPDNDHETPAASRRYELPDDRDDDATTVYTGIEPVHHLTGLPQLVAVHSTIRAVGFTDTEYAAWLKVYQAERGHLAKLAKMCIDAGIEERRQRVVESRAMLLRQVLEAALVKAGVKSADPAALIQEATRTVMAALPPAVGQ